MTNSLDQLIQAAENWPDEVVDPLPKDLQWSHLVVALLEDSLRVHASQVHIQSLAYCSVIRYRIDGLLVQRATLTHKIHQNLTIALKRYSRIDIQERRRPQFSARLEFTGNSTKQYYEVSSVPTSSYCSLVVNWRGARVVRRLAEMGLEKCQLKTLEEALSSRRGWLMNLNSTSLGIATLVALHQLGRRPVRIASNFVDDFAGLSNLGIEQRRLNASVPDVYYDWVKRQLSSDSDCYLIEVGFHLAQDILTACQNGKLILSGFGRSLACAPEFVELFNIDRRQFVENVIGSIEQKCVIANCPKCASNYKPSRAEIDALQIQCEKPDRLVFATSKGCEVCRNIYTRKQIGIHEIFLTADVKELILDNQPPEVIHRQLIAHGSMDFYTSMVRKVARREIPSWVAITYQHYLLRQPGDRERRFAIDTDDPTYCG